VATASYRVIDGMAPNARLVSRRAPASFAAVAPRHARIGAARNAGFDGFDYRDVVSWLKEG